jgi:hypothetical protein
MVGQIAVAAGLLLLPATTWLSFRWTRRARMATTAAVTLLSAVTAAILLGWVVRDELPSRMESALLYLPAALLIIGFGLFLDRRVNGPAEPRSASAFDPRAAVIFLSILSFCSVCAFATLSAGHRFGREPDPAVLLPLPDELALRDQAEDCGSELCSATFEIGAPDGATADEVTARLWRHLVKTKGWHRNPARPNTACRSIGWFTDYPTCVVISPGATPETISVLLSTALGEA